MSMQYSDTNGGAPAQYGAPNSPSMRQYPGGSPDPRYRPRPPPQQNPPPLAVMEPASTYYSGRDSPISGAEQWPLPALPLGQGSPRPSSPSQQSPRKPPPRPPREGYHDPMIAQYRQNARMAPGPGHIQHPRGPPPAQRPPQWAGDGYGSSQRPYPPNSAPRRPPPPRPAQPLYGDHQMSPRAMYQQQQRHPRPPQGMPPPGRRGPPPAGYYDQRGPPPPAAMYAGGDMATPLAAEDGLSPFTPPTAGKNIPSYYFEKRGNTPTQGLAASPGPGHHDSPMQTQQPSVILEDVPSERDEASPEPTTIIRQASLGKKTRPTLTTIKGSERKRGSSGESAPTLSSSPPNQPGSREQLTPFEEELEQPPGAWISEGPTPAAESSHSDDIISAAAIVGAEEMPVRSKSSDKKALQRRSSDILGADTHVRSISPVEPADDTDESSRDIGATIVSPIMTSAPLDAPRSPLSPSTLFNSPNNQALTPNSTTELKPADSRWSEESEKRKMKDLTIDIGKVREAEARGSITSLPDLIKRATRLASNLDRGKTASRMGLNFFDFNASSEAVEKLRAAEKAQNRRSGTSMSDMLTAFPAPGSRDGARGSKGNFSTMLRRSQLPSDSDAGEFGQEKKQRKCCGLSPKLFVLLMVLLFLLIAAAVIIPVVLVVLPKQDNNNNASTTAPPSNSALAECEKQLTCQNGGLNIIGSGESCSCLCINGYTGKTCNTLSKTGCTTMSAGSTKNATVGDVIPRLIEGANSNYTIPLDGETLLGLFSKSDLSCTSENALVTFSDSGTDAAAAVIVRDAELIERQSTSGSQPNKIIDFARVVVLYIFQQTASLSSAAAAQDTFQSYFLNRGTPTGTKFNPNNITLGSGFSCDLFEQSLVWVLKNGTTVAS